MRYLILTMMLIFGGIANAETYRDTSNPLTTIAALDLNRYMGRWYEIARFPISFEEGCIHVTADYSLRKDGKVTVLNTCVKATTGKVKTARGLAIGTAPATLKVSFIPVFKSFWLIDPNYYVLHISDDYDLAVVGLPKGNAGWILARTPQISKAELDTALKVLETNGYDIGRITMVPQPKE